MPAAAAAASRIISYTRMDLALNRYQTNECIICLTISNAGIPLQHGEVGGVYAQAG